MCERMYAFDPKRTSERWFGPAGWTQLPPHFPCARARGQTRVDLRTTLGDAAGCSGCARASAGSS